MANIDPAPSWANIRRLETSDRNMAGPGGILNDPITSIAARLNLLRDNDTTLGNSVAAVNSRQDATDAAISTIQDQVLNAPGTLSDLENGDALDPAAGFPDVPSVENSLGPIDSINNSFGSLASRDAYLKLSVDATSAKIEPLERIGGNIPHFTVLDESNRVLAKLTGKEATVFNYERIASQEAPVPLIIDESNRIIQYVQGASEKATSEAVENSSTIFQDRMRKFQIFRSAREAGSSARASIAVIGDSWADVTQYWLANFSKRMRDRYGDGGIGYVDFGSGTFPREGLSRTVSGWTVNNKTVAGPALYSRSASGYAIYSLAVVGAPALSAARMFWIGRVDGVCRYRWNSGSWVTLNLQVDGTNYTDLTDIPTGSTEYTFEIERVSGTIEICGIDLRSSTPGIVIHKLGNSGSRADNWLSVDAAQWQNGIFGISPDSVMILLGTNDRRDAVPADTFSDRIESIISRIRSAIPDTNLSPGPDIMSIVPSQVWRSTPLPMDDYRNEIFNMARYSDISAVSLIDAIGNPYTRRSWFDADGVHPMPDSGGLIVSGRIFESFNS